jgi:hypothetical protein
MKKKNSLVWILLAYGVIFLAYKYKKKKGNVIVEPVDKGEFPSPGKNYFPSDVPDYQN